MKHFKDAKNIYDHIVIPEELDDKLRTALDNAAESNPKSFQRFSRFSQWAATAAALLVVSFTIGLNTSETFAKNMSEIPVFGNIAKVLTIRSYDKTEENVTTKVTVPEVDVQADNEQLQFAITDVNAKIQSLVDTFTEQKYNEIAEYKEAFLATGGTETEWNERSIDVNVNYEIKSQSKTTLSLLVDCWISWFNTEEERHFYNIDLATGKELTLTDLLGEDAYAYASDCVLQQMQELIEADPETYVFWGVNEYDINSEPIGVTEDTLFYINEAGNVVITYDKYDVAPGYLGIQEFEIPAK